MYLHNLCIGLWYSFQSVNHSSFKATDVVKNCLVQHIDPHTVCCSTNVRPLLPKLTMQTVRQISDSIAVATSGKSSTARANSWKELGEFTNDPHINSSFQSSRANGVITVENLALLNLIYSLIFGLIISH